MVHTSSIFFAATLAAGAVSSTFAAPARGDSIYRRELDDFSLFERNSNAHQVDAHPHAPRHGKQNKYCARHDKDCYRAYGCPLKWNKCSLSRRKVNGRQNKKHENHNGGHHKQNEQKSAQPFGGSVVPPADASTMPPLTGAVDATVPLPDANAAPLIGNGALVPPPGSGAGLLPPSDGALPPPTGGAADGASALGAVPGASATPGAIRGAAAMPPPSGAAVRRAYDDEFDLLSRDYEYEDLLARDEYENYLNARAEYEDLMARDDFYDELD